MKKIFSFFTLLIFIVVGFVTNPMMSFAMQDMSDMKMWIDVNMENDCCSEDENFSEIPCKHDCCYESKWLLELSVVTTTRENDKKVKIKIKSLIDIFSFPLKLHENKSLTKITSPPNRIRKIKNYSYSNLIKIIKSNT